MKTFVKLTSDIMTYLFLVSVRCNTTAAPDKVEVFVDDKPVSVEPGTTLLQVNIAHLASNNRVQKIKT